MKIFQPLTDKVAIGLSIICVIHCLVLPSFLVLLPSMVATQLDNESFHFWMIVAVVPTSVFALTLGCKKHCKYHVLSIGLVGLVCLLLAVVLGESLGETWEKALTVFGAVILTAGHFKNFRLCQTKDDCECISDHAANGSEYST